MDETESPEKNLSGMHPQHVKMAEVIGSVQNPPMTGAEVIRQGATDNKGETFAANLMEKLKEEPKTVSPDETNTNKAADKSAA